MVLSVRDERGRVIDTTQVGVEELVEVIRARPPGRGPGDPSGDPSGDALGDRDRDGDLAVYGPAILSLEAVERLSRQVAALRAACGRGRR